VDPFAGLVPGPEVVAERLDDVVGRDAHVRGAGLEHLEDAVQDAGGGGVRALRLRLAARASQAVELAEQLVRAVDEVDDHESPDRSAPGGGAQEAARPRSSARSRAFAVSAAARSNSTRASPRRPSFSSRSPRTAGRRW